jgi:hypothetical protein
MAGKMRGWKGNRWVLQSFCDMDIRSDLPDMDEDINPCEFVI